MIAYLRGRVLEKGSSDLVLEVQGVGYRVHLTPTSLGRAGQVQEETEFYIEESVGLYGGPPQLYGFLNPGERELFKIFKEAVPNTGSKKALEYLERASRSLPDFRRAVLEGDAGMLSQVFGFSQKTALRLVQTLKGRLGSVAVAGSVRWSAGEAHDGLWEQALCALLGLGYKRKEAQEVLLQVREELRESPEISMESLLKSALRRL